MTRKLTFKPFVNGTNSPVSIDDVSNYLIAASDAASPVMFFNTADHQVVTNGNSNGATNFAGTVNSTPLLVNSTDADSSTAGNAASLDPGNSSTPSLSVNAANPADVTFTVSGVPSGYSGTVTFTDASGKQDVLPVQSNGTYSANLSNLADGTITYLLSVQNAAGNVITVDPTATLGDGSANALAGAPQFANLLSGEAVRPPWEVAGVDYAVGVPAGMSLKDPMTINMPGVSLDVADHVVNVTGNNVVLSGYDFSLEGGWEVSVNSGSGAVIEDDNFRVGSNAKQALYVSPSASNVTIEYNNFDGQGLAGEAGYQNQVQIGLGLDGGGTTTVEYNYIHDWWGQDIVLGSFDGGENWVIQYNVIANAGEGYNEGAHGDLIQSYNNRNATNIITNSRTIDYNTFIQNAPGSNTQGISESGQTNSNGIETDAINNNTFVTAAGATVTRAIIEDTTYLVGSATIENNYIDPSGIQYGWDFVGNVSGPNAGGPYNGTVTDYGNVDMATGAALDAAATTVTSVAASPSSGVETPGQTVTFALTLSAPVTVTGTPTLTLNDGGTATYKSGSGTNQLVFTYGVSSSDSTVSALAITSVNLPSGASITGGNGNAALMTGADVSFSGLSVSTAPTTPTIVSIQESPSSGDLNTGKTVTLTFLMGQAMTVTGTPTLTLNDGGTATYSNGSGTNALAFTYTVAAGQNTSALAITNVNLPAGAKITNSSGTAAGLSLTGLTQTGPQIDTTAPAAPVISGDTVNVNTVTLNGTAAANSTITVFDNSTQLGTTTTNSSGAWTYTTGALANGSQSFTATATDGAGNVSAASSALAMTLTAPVNLVTNGNFATGTLSGWTLGGNYYSAAYPLPQGEIYIDNNAEGSSTYAVGMGSVGSDGTLSQTIATTPGQTYTLSFWLQNEGSGSNDFAAIWNGQTLLSLTNAAQSGYTEYTYTVTATGSTSTLEFSAREDPNQWDLDNISLTPNGTPAATVSSIAESPSGGDLNAGKTVTLTLTMSGAVTVAGGTPTLTLNDGGTATYTGGSGSSALTFSYTVAAGQNTASLAATAVNLNGATITNGGNAASLSLSGLTQSGPQIDTTTPTISAIGEVPSSGDLSAGKTVTYTLTLSEAVTVNTSAGSPTLSLNDGGTASYVSGSGTNALTFLYTVLAGQNTPDLTVTAVNLNGGTIADGVGNAANLSLTGIAQGSPQVDTTAPVISSVAESPSSGNLNAGKTVTLTLDMSEAVTVAGGTPTLSLNDGGTATYTGGSGSSALTFSYTVASGQNTASLAVTAVNLNSATIKDGAGNAANLSLSGLTQTGPQIGIIGPTVSSILDSPSSGDLNAGKSVTLTLNMSEAVTVAGGTPTLSLNDGGTATYTGGSGSSALTFSYTVAAGQNTASLAATAVNLNSASITDGAGNAASLSLSGLTQSGPQIDTTTPTVSSVVASGTGITNGSGDLNAGKTVTLTLTMSGAVTVAGGTPTLSLNDGGTATYTGGSGSSALTFSYTVAAGQNTPDLTATAVNLNGATITDGAGNAANLSGAVTSPAGTLQIDTTTPTISSIAESPSSGDLNAGKTVTYALTLSEAVTVAGGTPTLSLNDGGTATYTGGSGSTALTFSYTVASGQNTPDLTATTFNLNGATIADGAGNAANLSLTGIAQGSPQVDTTPPVISSVAESPSSGNLNAGKTVTLTLNMSEAVTVAGGTPTLSLNDGGTATYIGGSGSSALTFSYTVASGQNTASLVATAINLNSASIKDGAGNAANLSLSGLTQTGPQISTTGPTVSSILDSPSSGALNAGKTATLTLNMSEAVTVAGGTPTLSLNDGGTATYTGGSGSSALTFSYTVAAGQNAASLAATAVNLNSASITDGAGNAASLSLSGLTQSGPQIETTTPTISSIAESPSSGDLNADKTVTLTLNMTEAVTIAGGTPTLSLNDGGTATYTGGSGSSALTFSYTVAGGQNTAVLAATAVNLNSATIKDGAGNAAGLSLSGLTQTGPQIDTTVPAPPVITGDTVNANNTVALAGTAEANSTVRVYDGSTELGTTTAGAGGTWNYTTGTLNTGTQVITSTATDGAGNTSAASNAVNPVITQPPPTVVTLPTSQPATIPNDTILEVNGPDKGSVTFTGATGALVLNQPSTFLSNVSGFGAETEIDLPGVAFSAQSILGYSPNGNNNGGTLSITNGTQSANIALLGSYMASSFVLEADNNGGTLVVTPASQQNGNHSLLVIPQHS